MTSKITQFDVADYLDNESILAEYLSAILAEGDTSLLISAIGDIAKAKGMSQIASSSGLGRESLYKALNPTAKPRFETIVKVLKSLGLSLTLSSSEIKTAAS
jgi:probable addiction module antidote protein